MRDSRPLPRYGDLPKRSRDRRRPERDVRSRVPEDDAKGADTGPAHPERPRDAVEAFEVCV